MTLAEGVIREDRDSLEHLRMLEALHGSSARLKTSFEAKNAAAIREGLDEWAAATAAATATRERLDAKERIRMCPHEWASMVNKVIESGEWCPKCGALKP